MEIVNFHNSIRPQVVKSLLLIGAGKISYYLLNILSNNKRKIDLKVIEIDQKRAEWFSQEFPDLYVIQGDGTSKDILMEERAGNFDAVATFNGRRRRKHYLFHVPE